MTAAAWDTRRWFWIALAATTVLRFAMAATVPPIHDEAYFFEWARRTPAGFYEHPGLLLWMLALLGRFSEAEWVLRLPAVAGPAIAALVLVRVLRDAGASAADASRAYAAGLVLLLVPAWSLWFPITTDVPLALFSFLSVGTLCLAVRRGSLGLHAIAGVFLGLALSSKYLAALVALAYAVFALVSPPGERRWRGVAVAYACAAPFVAVNIAWNHAHCWTNVVFNLYARHGNVPWSWWSPVAFGLTTLYLVAPVAVMLASTAERRLVELWREPAARLAVLSAGVPLLALLGVSLVTRVEMYLVLPFVAPLVLGVAPALTAAALRRGARTVGIFLVLHVPALAVALSLLSIPGDGASSAYAQWRSRDALIAALASYGPEVALATTRGSTSALLAYGLRRHGTVHRDVLVFGPGNAHFRQPDAVHDFRALDGRDIVVLVPQAPALASFAPFFAGVDVRVLHVDGATFWLVLGRRFSYPVYRDRVLTTVRDRFYRIPAFLPQGRCAFCERYFGATCPTR